jgi:hypothetical protein
MSKTQEYDTIYYICKVNSIDGVVHIFNVPKEILDNIYAKYGWKACTVAEQVTAWIADNFTVITAATRNRNHYVQAHLWKKVLHWNQQTL